MKLSAIAAMTSFAGFLAVSTLSVSGCATHTTDHNPAGQNVLMSSAYAGDPAAMVAVGDHYQTGRVFRQDYALALFWYQKAAKLGSPIAQLKAAQLLLGKLSGTENAQLTAQTLLSQSADQGNADAQLLYADLLIESIDETSITSANSDSTVEEKAYSLYLASANQENAEAQFKLATMLNVGIGTIQANTKEATLWYHRSAENGYVKAQLALGNRYLYGIGLTESAIEAYNWYEKSARQGSYLAQSHLGDMLTIPGYGVVMEKEGGIAWYTKAAHQGYAHAQSRLGSLLSESTAASNQIAEGVNWIRASARQGYAPAQCQLGEAYYQGTVLPQDLTLADLWFNRAAEQAPAGILPILGFVHYDCDQFDSDRLLPSAGVLQTVNAT